MFVFRQPWQQGAVAGLIAVAMAGATATAGTLDRDFRFGDDGLENIDNESGIVVGSNNDTNVAGVENGNTIDSQGPSGAFLDGVVQGDPVYVNDPRPNARQGDQWAAEFDGDGDAVTDSRHLNLPETLPDRVPDYPLTLEGIRSHGMSAWVKPDSSLQNASGDPNRRVVMRDTSESVVFLDPPGEDPDDPDSPDNDQWRWGYQMDNPQLVARAAERSEPVEFGEWTHVSHVSGLETVRDGSSSFGSALLVNGIAVDAAARDIDTGGNFEAGLAIGSNQNADDNFFEGRIDDAKTFFWGNNTEEGGEDWGRYNPNVDNGWIKKQWEDMGVDPEGPVATADVNGDGVISGDGTGSPENDDLAALAEGWNFEKIFTDRIPEGQGDEIRVGDWETRQEGDLNYNGRVGLGDFFLLASALEEQTGSAPTLAEFRQIVPEPASLALLGLGGTLLLGRQRRRA